MSAVERGSADVDAYDDDVYAPPRVPSCSARARDVPHGPRTSPRRGPVEGRRRGWSTGRAPRDGARDRRRARGGCEAAGSGTRSRRRRRRRRRTLRRRFPRRITRAPSWRGRRSSSPRTSRETTPSARVRARMTMTMTMTATAFVRVPPPMVGDDARVVSATSGGAMVGALREGRRTFDVAASTLVTSTRNAGASATRSSAESASATCSSAGSALPRRVPPRKRFSACRNPENYPDWSPLRNDAWDVLVAAYEDVPAPTVPGSRDPVVCGDGETSASRRVDTPCGRIASAQIRPTRWRRVVFDEPQELNHARRPGARCGAGAWLTVAFSTNHRWALTATPGTGDALRDVASLLHGAASLPRAIVAAREVDDASMSSRSAGRVLPAPALIRVAEPVTLTWHEASTVQLYAEAFDATFADVVKMCSGFAGEGGRVGRRTRTIGRVGRLRPANRLVVRECGGVGVASRGGARDEARGARDPKRRVGGGGARGGSARRRTPSPPRAGITPSNNSTTS